MLNDTPPQIYTQLVTCQEELLNSKDENRRLNSYLEQILNDIEERAPALKQQRDDFERAQDMLEAVKAELQKEKEQHETDKDEAESARRKLAHSSRENERSQKQIKDLSVQVTTMVREVEAARFGRTTKHDGILTSPGGSQGIR